MSEIKTIAVSTEYHMSQSPFMLGDKVAAYCAAAGKKLYGAMHPGTNPLRMGDGIDTLLADDPKIIQIAGDGATVAFTHVAYPDLARAHVDGGALGEADRLRVIVQEIGGNGEVLRTLNRVAAGAAPADGEFKTSGAVTLTVGAALDEGAWFRVLILDSADIVTADLDQYVPTEVTIYDFMSADNACKLEALR